MAELVKNKVGDYDELFIEQTGSGCCGEMFSCGLWEGNTEFTVRPMNNKKNVVMYVGEESSCLCRCCCGPYRSMKIKVHDGKDDKAPSFIQYNRSFACMPSNLKCCCYQEMSAKLLTDEKKEEGKDIGSFVESFYWCHTQFNVVDEEGKVAYHVHPPTCCCGMCVSYCPEASCSTCKLGCCRIPFDIYDPKSGKSVGKICKVWGGLATEVFTDADSFECKFPPEATPNEKALILGGVFLINQLYFENGSVEKVDNNVP